ncbi:hypothetical protein GOP47_0012050 [Adiantum capillus-veneris]|uniref:Glutaredoxin domain-containing protein n=1 Tax=Adiantum capillus-veneris TaxID=13818 RepID=A0A9D4UV54_ADICA|nr:hypothetical protein GOP47_0012050 [Adiantum capillus-veneris]
MGSSPSKQQSRQDGHDVSLLHSMSLPNRNRLESREDGRKFSWKSRLSSMPTLVGRESSLGSIFGLSSTLRQVPEEDVDACQPSVLVQEQLSSVGVPNKMNEKSLRRTVSFQPTWDSSPDAKRSFSQKPMKKEASGAEGTLALSMKLDSVCDFLPHKDERSAGLRSLLNPVLMPSHSFASPTRPASDPSKAVASWMSFKPRANDCSPGKSSTFARSNSFRGSSFGNSFQAKLELSPGKSSFSARSSSFRDLSIRSNSQAKVDLESGSDIVNESVGSPLFDPLILATFEKALESLSDDSNHSSDLNTNDNSSSASESESSSDSESLALHQEGMVHLEDFDSGSCPDVRILRSPSTLRASAFLNRKVSFSRVFSLKNDESWTGRDYLDRFEMMCPPGGENKVILYFTSLRVVRKTFEDCCMLRLILKGLRVHVDERDVWMHSNFRKELTEVMGAALSVPRLFIRGRYIGGAVEVEQLHEEGILGKMLEGLCNDSRQECEVCGDVRFIPCITCFGSCKFVSQEDVLERCPDCNENGLIMCPHCDR